MFELFFSFLVCLFCILLVDIFCVLNLLKLSFEFGIILGVGFIFDVGDCGSFDFCV